MIFKNKTESASLLCQKITGELKLTNQNTIFGYINPDAQTYCQLLGEKSKTKSRISPSDY